METTAKQISDWAREHITVLAKDPPYGTLISVYNAIHAVSGLSISTIMKFTQRPGFNLTASSLDRMVAAIKVLSHRKKVA